MGFPGTRTYNVERRFSLLAICEAGYSKEGNLKKFLPPLTFSIPLRRDIFKAPIDGPPVKKGITPLRVREIDLNMLVTTTAKHMALISARHTLRLALEKVLPHLEGDPEKLIQVITNVLSNAIKYSPMGGEILITSSTEGKSVHVSIQDHGIGIASDVIKNIFTPYYRVNARSTRYIEGTSLGLSLVNEIIHLHEGKIWIESTPGYGSTFHLSLPHAFVK